MYVGLPYTPNLVVKDHPLNVGRLAWWLALPGLEGGKTWFDLLNSYHGTCAGMDSSSSGWQSSMRPGGAGCLKFDGSDDRIDISVPVPTSHTIACWAKLDAVGNYPVLISAHPNNYLGYYYQAAMPRFAGPGMDLYSGTALTIGRWYRLVATSNQGISFKLYVNGSEVASGGSYATPNQTYTSIGAHKTGFYSNSTIDDVSIWGRTLTPTEVFEDYQLSSLGYPGLIRKQLRSPTDLTYLIDIPLWVYGGKQLAKAIELRSTGISLPPIYAGGASLIKGIVFSINAEGFRPIFSGEAILIKGIVLRTTPESILPIYSGLTNLIKNIEIITSPTSIIPAYGGTTNLIAQPMLIVVGHYVLEGFIFEDTLYVTDYIDLGTSNA